MAWRKIRKGSNLQISRKINLWNHKYMLGTTLMSTVHRNCRPKSAEFVKINRCFINCVQKSWISMSERSTHLISRANGAINHSIWAPHLQFTFSTTWLNIATQIQRHFFMNGSSYIIVNNKIMALFAHNHFNINILLLINLRLNPELVEPWYFHHGARHWNHITYFKMAQF